LFISGCGYKPTSYYAKHEIKGKVFVNLNVNIDNATNSVLIKDAVNEMVITQFGATLTNDKQKADTIVDVSLEKVSHKVLQDDNQGYAKLYRTTVSIRLDYNHKGDNNSKKSLNVSGTDDYAVDDDSLITDAKKQESVKIAAMKALSEIFSKVAIQTFKENNNSRSLLKEQYNTNVKNTSKSKSFFFFN
jgi:hypothetical protein